MKQDTFLGLFPGRLLQNEKNRSALLGAAPTRSAPMGGVRTSHPLRPALSTCGYVFQRQKRTFLFIEFREHSLHFFQHWLIISIFSISGKFENILKSKNIKTGGIGYPHYFWKRIWQEKIETQK